MSFTLVIGSKNYSSWSMRAWLLLRLVEAPFEEIMIDLYTDTSRAKVRDLGGQTGLVPVLIDGPLAIWDTLAITEYLYESHPSVWPAARSLRARARSICGEVHSSLGALREAMPVNTRGRNRLAPITDEVDRDVNRVQEIWEDCLSEGAGPWLFGEFCAADVFFAPIATRFQTYGVGLRHAPREYCDQVLAHLLVAEWLELGRLENTRLERFELPGE